MSLQLFLNERYFSLSETRRTPIRSIKRKTEEEGVVHVDEIADRKRLKKLLFDGQQTVESDTTSLSDLAGLDYIQKVPSVASQN